MGVPALITPICAPGSTLLAKSPSWCMSISAAVVAHNAIQLILQGRYDWVTPMAGAVEMAEKLPYAQLHIFERSGHMVFMEEPEELVSVLKHWITSTFGMR